jgi:hypothetical protein
MATGNAWALGLSSHNRMLFFLLSILCRPQNYDKRCSLCITRQRVNLLPLYNVIFVAMGILTGGDTAEALQVLEVYGDSEFA